MNPASGRELYRIGDLLLDGASKTLYRDGRVVPLAYRSAQLLLELARNYPSVVRRIDLIESLWPTEDVTDQALSQRVSVLRKEIGDSAESPRYIGRMWGWGYHLLAPVERLGDEATPPGAESPHPAAPLAETAAPGHGTEAVPDGPSGEGLATPLLSGQRLGPYEVLGPLGTGGMGEVYRARDTRLGREVAVKVLPTEVSKDPVRLHRFEQEARAAASLNHPNIVVLYDIGTQEGTPFMVTELLQGDSLLSLLHRGPLPVLRAVELGVQLAQGLAAAHEKGIVHRDLKPDNLFVTKDGVLKILDFGLARLRSPEAIHDNPDSQAPKSGGPTHEGQVLGTPGYMSPEQIRGQWTDARSDIFSCGCVLYEMVSGRRPFAGTTPADAAAAILKEEPPDLPGLGRRVPVALDRIIRRCLAKKRTGRFSSAQDLAFALQTLAGSWQLVAGSSAETAAYTPAGDLRQRRLLHTHRAWVAAGFVFAALAFLGTAFFFIQGWAPRLTMPTLHQLTFRRGYLGNARFTPDGRNVIYAAAWDGNPLELYSVGLGSPESRPLGFEGAELSGVFPNADLALLLPGGTLARVPLNGGAPREVLAGVTGADVGDAPRELLAVRPGTGTYRIEYPLGKVLFQTTRGIGNPRLSHSGDRVAFTCESPREVWMTGVDGKAAALSKGWRHLNGLAWVPSDTELWFTGGREGLNMALYAVTPSGRERLVYRTPGQLVLQDISPGGKVLFSRQSSRQCLVAGNTSSSEELDLSWFDYGFLRALSSDGKRVLFTERGEPVAGKNVVYIRGTDGSPAVRLGEGYGLDLSGDGAWVLARVPGERGDQLVALPTGPGQPRPLTGDSLNHADARWMPDGRGFVFLGNEPEHDARFFFQAVDGGKPRPLTPEGRYSSSMALSPDGRDLAYFDADREGISLVSTDGGSPRPVPGVQDGDRPITFGADPQTLLVRRRRSVFRVDLRTGKATLVREFEPRDPAGFAMGVLLMTPDEKTYAYGYYRELSDLFVAEGLK
jgi:eukaryotic-like serine/threonine-protein kinase